MPEIIGKNYFSTDFLSTEMKSERNLFTNRTERENVGPNLEASEYRKAQFAAK